jgi:S1-C subfamily serine protease/lipoprotein NlpI
MFSHPKSIAALAALIFETLLVLTTIAAADDTATCTTGTGAAAIAACTRLMSAGGQTNHDISLLFDRRALHFIEAGKLDNAMADYNKAIQLDPNSPFPYGGKGVIFATKGDYSHAIESVSAGLRLNPNDSQMYTLRGDSYSKIERFDLAIADYNSAMKIDPKSELALAGRGQSYFQIGELDRAIVDLSRAIQLDPSDPDPYLVRGRAYAKKGDYGRAIADLTTAITVPHPRVDVLYLARGDAYEHHGDLQDALGNYRKAAASRDTRLAAEANAGVQRIQLRIATTESSGLNKLEAIGSGFLVSNRGYFLTNYHVVKECSKVRLGSPGEMNESTIFATDESNDLAILRAAAERQAPLSLRIGRTVKPGDQIVLTGFPLPGTKLVSTSTNVSMGTISALAGPNDDSRWLQISAPIQPGNSGGPVVDLGGNVVGVVVATVNAAAMLKSEGVIPQNINFAIKSNIAANFLDAKSVPYDIASSEIKMEPG